MRRIGNEIKTGIMVVICLAILLGLTVRIGGLGSLKKGYEMKVQFNYAAGLKEGAPVYLTGVEMGEIKDVQIDYTDEGTVVIFSLWLDSAAKLRRDSVAFIATMGLMGEKYLELSSGSPGSPFLPEGSLIVGKEPILMDEMMEKANEIADNLNAGISDLRILTKNVDSTLVENRAQIDEIIKNMTVTSKNFEEFSDDIKRHPWKLLFKTKEKKPRDKGTDKGGNRGLF